MSSPAPYGEQPKSSGGSFLTIILIVLGVIFLLCAGVCGGCYILASRAGTAMVLELQAFGPSLAASMSQEVIDKLGNPVEKVGNPRQITPISFEFDIKGPKGTAVVSVVAEGEGENYKITSQKVTFEDGTTIDLPVGDDTFDESEETMESEPLTPETEEMNDAIDGALETDPGLNIPLEPSIPEASPTEPTTPE